MRRWFLLACPAKYEPILDQLDVGRSILSCCHKAKAVSVGRRLVAGLIVAITIAFMASPGAGAGTSPHALVIVSPATVTETLSGNPKSAKVSVVVRNDGATVTDLHFSFVGQGEMTITPSTSSIAADQAGEIPLTLTPKNPNQKYTGVLLAGAAGATPGTISLELDPSEGAPWWLYVVIFGPMIGAAIFVALRALTFQLPQGVWSAVGGIAALVSCRLQ